MYEVCFKIIDFDGIDEEHRVLWLYESFKYALISEEMDNAVKLWD
jgi:hypothetical protein